MVDTGTGFTGVKRSHGLWANKLLLGGSAFDQTGGAVVEIAISGTNVTLNSGSLAISGAAMDVFGRNADFTTGSLSALTILNDAGSPWGQGITHQFTARAICSGGAFVWLSGNSLAMGSPFIAATNPIGVALAAAGSNATVDVLTHGIYPLVAEGTILAGAAVKPGVGVATGAYNSVVDAGSPSYGVIGTALTGVTSGTTTKLFVYIGHGAGF